MRAVHPETHPRLHMSGIWIMFKGIVLFLTLSILASSAAWAQEPQTREEADRQRREQQAKEVEGLPAERPGADAGLRRGQGDLHPRPRGLPSEARLVDHRQRVRLRPRLSRSRSVLQQRGARNLGGRERQALLGDRGAAQVSAARKQPPAPGDLGQPPRLSPGELLRPRSRFRPGRSVRLRDSHEPLRWPRRRQAGRAPARRRRARVPGPAAR